MDNSTKIDYPSYDEWVKVSAKCHKCGKDINDVYCDCAVFIDDWVHCRDCADEIMFAKKR